MMQHSILSLICSGTLMTRMAVESLIRRRHNCSFGRPWVTLGPITWTSQILKGCFQSLTAMAQVQLKRVKWLLSSDSSLVAVRVLSRSNGKSSRQLQHFGTKMQDNHHHSSYNHQDMQTMTKSKWMTWVTAKVNMGDLRKGDLNKSIWLTIENQ